METQNLSLKVVGEDKSDHVETLSTFNSQRKEILFSHWLDLTIQDHKEVAELANPGAVRCNLHNKDLWANENLNLSIATM